MGVNSLISLVIYIVILGVVAFLLNYLVDQVPMDPTFKRVAKVVILVVSVLIVIVLLLGLINGGPVLIRP